MPYAAAKEATAQEPPSGPWRAATRREGGGEGGEREEKRRRRRRRWRSWRVP